MTGLGENQKRAARVLKRIDIVRVSFGLLLVMLCMGPVAAQEDGSMPQEPITEVVETGKGKQRDGLLKRVRDRIRERREARKEKGESPEEVEKVVDRVILPLPKSKEHIHGKAVTGLLDIIEDKDEQYEAMEIQWADDNEALLDRVEQQLQDAGLLSLHRLAMKERENSLMRERHVRDSIYQSRIAELEKKEILHRLEENQARSQEMATALTAGGIGFGMLSFCSYFLWVANKRKKRLNALIMAQKAEVENQKSLIELKNQEREDSILYAKKLQDAVLPSQALMAATFKDSFVFFKPRDIVAGDFYWMERSGDEVWYAVADCTGHGVPGAMLSVVCANALDRAFNEFALREPGVILDKVRELVVETYSGSSEGLKDGMDITLVRHHLVDKTLQYAGANNPLWIVRLEEREPSLLEIEADRQPVGPHERTAPFTTQQVQLQCDDLVYLFTDGFADQFGGENGKKFKSKNFKRLLREMHGMSMKDQREQLSSFFKQWKGELDQVDDICVLGVRA